MPYGSTLGRSTIRNTLHGTGKRIEDTSKGIIPQIEEKAESAYIYLTMNAQLNIKDGVFHSIDYL